MSGTYRTMKYNSKARWLSYWYQISEALSFGPKSLLLIGKGSGVTEAMMGLFGEGKIRVVVLDIDSGLVPDVAADVRFLPFVDKGFDVIVCCQVLEHLPFDALPGVLREFRRVAEKGIVISVPHGRKSVKLSFSIQQVYEKDIILKNPLTKKKIRSKQHFWEIGRGVTRQQFRKQLSEFFEIDREFLNEVNCAHRFFVMRPKQ